MKKKLKITLGIISGIIAIIILDTIQAMAFDNSPIIKIREYYNGGTLNYKDKGILVDTYSCIDGKKDTTLKGFSYSCSYNGGNYTLVDETKNKIGFSCAEVLQSFYEDETHIYYWECMKNKYMIVKYKDGSKELISEALKNKHIDIDVLSKFDIDYIKEKK